MLAEQSLRTCQRCRAVFHELRCQFSGSLAELLRGNDFVNQADPKRFIRANNPAGQQQVPRLLFTNLTEQKSRNDCRDESNSNFRVSKLGFRHAQSKVAKRSESAASGDSRSVHRRDRRLGEVIQ